MGKFLYVTNIEDGTISAFQTNPSTGALSAANNSPFPTGMRPAGIAVGRTGEFRLFRNSCGCESIISQALRHEVEPAEMKKDSHSEALAISKPTGHFLYPLYAIVLCF